MAAPTIQRGSTFTGSIDFKQIIPPGSNNQFPYTIPVGAVVEVHLPPDSAATPTPVTNVILSSATNLPNPPFTTTEVVINGGRTGVTFTCTSTKSLQMKVGKGQAIDVKVIKDPATTPRPIDIDIFEKLKVIDVKDPENV